MKEEIPCNSDTANGCLTVSTEELANLTLAEAKEYYQDGMYYVCSGKLYIFSEEDTCFIESGTGSWLHTIKVDAEALGTFLPDVASEGLSFEKAKDQDKAATFYALGLKWPESI